MGGVRGPVATQLKAAGKRAVRFPPVRAAALHAAAWLGHGLVLVYHRVVPDGADEPAPVVPSVPAYRLREHLDVLSALGDIVPLDSLLESVGTSRRPRFAITFDDDYVEHLTQVRSVLAEARVPATLFLSGRSLHGLGGYWWQQLEWLVARQGARRTAQVLGLPTGTPAQLAAACETNATARHRLGREAPADVGGQLDAAGIRTLAGDANLVIGFHTLHHELLTGLGARALRAAVTTGRDELEGVVEAPVRLFAYPHGKAGQGAAEAVRAAGYLGAWTGQPRPIRRRDDRFLLGRWECGPMDVDAFTVAVAVRLHRSAPASA